MFEQPEGESEAQGRTPSLAGTSVYDANGVRIGNVSNPVAQRDYLVVEKGMFFTHPIYIPQSAIARTDSSGIHLKLSRDALGDERFARAPTGVGFNPTPDSEVVREDTDAQPR